MIGIDMGHQGVTRTVDSLADDASELLLSLGVLVGDVAFQGCLAAQHLAAQLAGEQLLRRLGVQRVEGVTKTWKSEVSKISMADFLGDLARREKRSNEWVCSLVRYVLYVYNSTRDELMESDAKAKRPSPNHSRLAFGKLLFIQFLEMCLIKLQAKETAATSAIAAMVAVVAVAATATAAAAVGVAVAVTTTTMAAPVPGVVRLDGWMDNGDGYDGL
ncbi:hypothetical protein V1478_009340 [Vespula squamosa]|uniref:Uncharacterized protein n=1 Tax=Vespula squamosa TaxID=30214 RepID=A0ABD2APD2_VESSQ